jgi:hypothetical protein
MLGCGSVYSPKSSVNFVTDNYGRWAPAINNENFHHRKQAPSSLVVGNETLGQCSPTFRNDQNVEPVKNKNQKNENS